MLSRIKRHKKLTALVLTAMLFGGVALAAWLISATGSSRGRTGSLTAPTVSAGTFSSQQKLYPGASGDLVVNVDNPNGPLVVTGAALTGAGVGTSASSDCPGSNFTDTPLAGLSIAIPSGVSEVVLPGIVSMKTDASTLCQGLEVMANVRLDFSTP